MHVDMMEAQTQVGRDLPVGRHKYQVRVELRRSVDHSLPGLAPERSPQLDGTIRVRSRATTKVGYKLV
jgi:hypothetical protein